MVSVRLGFACIASLFVACSSDDDATRADVYDDTAERAALVESRGFAYVGFVPVTERVCQG